MDAVGKHEVLSTAISLLDQRETTPEGVYWFCGEDADEGLSYCYDCIKAINPNAKLGYDFCGGSTNGESDSCEVCEHCGKVLGYVLTDYGVSRELENFIEYGFDWSSSQECYELARVAHGMILEDKRRDHLLDILLNAKNVPSELMRAT